MLEYKAEYGLLRSRNEIDASLDDAPRCVHMVELVTTQVELIHASKELMQLRKLHVCFH